MLSETLFDIPIKRIDGTPTTLAEYRGKALLIVNVASKCGLTPQYEALEALYEKFRERGLVVVGFPSNEFMGQEPGTNAEIAEFCQMKFGVKFPLFEKIVVKGKGQHPLYAALTRALPTARKPGANPFRLSPIALLGALRRKGDVSWNFEKFLVNRQGEVVDRFHPEVKPDDPMVREAIEAVL
jgi:glutathione peroxidase